MTELHIIHKKIFLNVLYGGVINKYKLIREIIKGTEDLPGEQLRLDV